MTRRCLSSPVLPVVLVARFDPATSSSSSSSDSWLETYITVCSWNQEVKDMPLMLRCGSEPGTSTVLHLNIVPLRCFPLTVHSYVLQDLSAEWNAAACPPHPFLCFSPISMLFIHHGHSTVGPFSPDLFCHCMMCFYAWPFHSLMVCQLMFCKLPRARNNLLLSGRVFALSSIGV